MAKKKSASDYSDAVNSIIDNLQSAFSKELIKPLASEDHKQQIEGISWQLPSVNHICTKNPFVGIPYGRFVELFGPESSGKTTLALTAIADAQFKKLVCGYIDAEHAVDLDYSINLGVDPTLLIFNQPDYGEQAIDIAVDMIKAGVKVIVIDSVAALIPLAELEGDTEKAQMGMHARLMSKAMKKLKGITKKHGAIIIWINQIRHKIGVIFGSPETTTGGWALKFYADLRIDCRLSTAQSKALKGGMATLTGKKEKERVGSLGTLKCIKNKIASPFGDTEVSIYYGLGYDKVGDWYEFAVQLGLIEKGKGVYKVVGQSVKYDEMEKYVEQVIELVKGFYEESR